MQGCNYACLAVGASAGPVYAAGSDNKLKALEDAGSAGLRIAADLEAGCAITQLALPSGACPQPSASTGSACQPLSSKRRQQLQYHCSLHASFGHKINLVGSM